MGLSHTTDFRIKYKCIILIESYLILGKYQIVLKRYNILKIHFRDPIFVENITVTDINVVLSENLGHRTKSSRKYFTQKLRHQFSNAQLLRTHPNLSTSHKYTSCIWYCNPSHHIRKCKRYPCT